jgi:site-specific DNA recombinase
LTISRWFEEQQTAAKSGRPVWNAMLKGLRKGTVAGVIIHKIDRSARNLKDWADLGELIDRGIEVHFANEAIDLQSRGGRLSADIQAVIASDFIRNLREETKKGIYGRLKQGIYPLRAPLGYLDNGSAKLKTVDPVRGPLVQKAFELYGTGQWSLPTLIEELYRRGLRNANGGRVTLTGLHTFLRNPFYTGVIRIRASGETYQGKHDALITRNLFDRVQDILHGRVGTRVQVHDFEFRRFIRCAACGNALIGELQKGHVYYRCHTKACAKTSIREDVVASLVEGKLRALTFSREEKDELLARIGELKASWVAQRAQECQQLTLQIDQLSERLNRTTDAYLEGVLDREAFEERKATLVTERRALTDRRADYEANRASIPDELQKFVELAGTAYSLYCGAITAKKRRLLRTVMSNCTINQKEVDIAWRIPFCYVAEREEITQSALKREIGRTSALLITRLLGYFAKNAGALDFSIMDL